MADRAVAGEPLFVRGLFKDYYPGTRPEARTIFGRPKKAAPRFTRSLLPVPLSGRPVSPAAATTPGPALKHSGKLPRAGAGPEAWKK